jgi:hypothetical protein
MPVRAIASVSLRRRGFTVSESIATVPLHADRKDGNSTDGVFPAATSRKPLCRMV